MVLAGPAVEPALDWLVSGRVGGETCSLAMAYSRPSVARASAFTSFPGKSYMTVARPGPVIRYSSASPLDPAYKVPSGAATKEIRWGSSLSKCTWAVPLAAIRKSLPSGPVAANTFLVFGSSANAQMCSVSGRVTSSLLLPGPSMVKILPFGIVPASTLPCPSSVSAVTAICPVLAYSETWPPWTR